MSNAVDMSDTIIAKSDQLNAVDFGGEQRRVLIRDVRKGSDEKQPISIYYEDDNNRPFKPCLMMRRVLVEAWGKDGTSYVGRSMVLYVDQSVVYGGKKVGGIRIAALSHMERDLETLVRPSRGVVVPYTVKALRVDQQPAQSQGEPTADTDPSQIIDALRVATDHAMKGTEAFRTWFNSEKGKPIRNLFKDDDVEMEKLKKLCQEADDDADENGGREL